MRGREWERKERKTEGGEREAKLVGKAMKEEEEEERKWGSVEEGRKDEEERSVEIICAFLNRVCLCVCVCPKITGR